ncbi:MAG: glycosyltransferase, partial [Pyrinomonadaceae bacterium]
MNQDLMKVRLLALSFYYPPVNNPRAVQVDRLLRHACLSTSLLCADYNQTNERVDHLRISPAAEFLENCVRVPYLETWWQRTSSRLAHRFHPLLMDKQPDRFMNWKPAVLKAVESLLSKGDPPDVLVTFGSPMSDHIIGLELKKRFGWPWLAHFSDPWVDNVFKDFTWLTRSINLSLERQVMESADRLIFTSLETIDLIMSKYPRSLRSKARVLPHAFESGSFQSQAFEFDSRIVIRYIGDMYGRRTPEPLFNALKSILVSEPQLLDDVFFEFVGSMHDLKVDQMGIADLRRGLVGFQPTVGYAESLDLMTSAQGLLVIDAPAEQSVFLPSKLIDYIGAGRPILGITPPGTATRLIAELGGWVCDPAYAEET